MNPNQARLLKRLSVVMLIVLLLTATYFALRFYTPIQINSILAYIFYLFIALLVAGVFTLILRVVLRMLWPVLINRSESINLCCPDINGQGIHLVGNRYDPGGKFTKGSRAFSHYYITTDGKIFLSKKFNPDQFTDSLEDLQRQAKTPLAFDLGKRIAIGYYQDHLEDAVQLEVKGSQIEIRGFERWIDYGFSITKTTGGKVGWEKKV